MCFHKWVKQCIPYHVKRYLVSLRKRVKCGDRPPNRYYLFSIEVELGKKLKYANYGAYQKRCETVCVKEIDALEKPKKTTPELIETSSG